MLMIVAFDTYYFKNKAKTIGVSFKEWSDENPLEIYSETIDEVEEYEPGLFYKRELPCILSLLNKIDTDKIEIIIVDSYVFLDNDRKLGLGGYLFQQLEQKIPVIGVAKSRYHSNKSNTRELLRGQSKKPLYISAVGIELDIAYKYIKSMFGNYRIPKLLQIMDSKTK